MQFKFKNPQRSEHAVLADKVYAALETGNIGTARVIATEYADRFPEQAAALVRAVVKDYGVKL